MRRDPPALLHQPGAAAEAVGDGLGDLALHREDILRRRSQRSDQRLPPVPASKSCAVTRTRPASRVIDPSTTKAAPSAVPIPSGSAAPSRYAAVAPLASTSNSGNPPEIGDHVLGQPAGEEPRARVLGHRLERQHRDPRHHGRRRRAGSHQVPAAASPSAVAAPAAAHRRRGRAAAGAAVPASVNR